MPLMLGQQQDLRIASLQTFLAGARRGGSDVLNPNPNPNRIYLAHAGGSHFAGGACLGLGLD